MKALDVALGTFLAVVGGALVSEIEYLITQGKLLLAVVIMGTAASAALLIILFQRKGSLA